MLQAEEWPLAQVFYKVAQILHDQSKQLRPKHLRNLTPRVWNESCFNISMIPQIQNEGPKRLDIPSSQGPRCLYRFIYLIDYWMPEEKQMLGCGHGERPEPEEAKCRLSDGNAARSKETAASVSVRQAKRERRTGRLPPHDRAQHCSRPWLHTSH